MDVDEALGRLGAVGKWQITYYSVLSIAVMFPTCWHMLAFTFIGLNSLIVLSRSVLVVVLYIFISPER